MSTKPKGSIGLDSCIGLERKGDPDGMDLMLWITCPDDNKARRAPYCENYDGANHMSFFFSVDEGYNLLGQLVAALAIPPITPSDTRGA